MDRLRAAAIGPLRRAQRKWQNAARAGVQAGLASTRICASANMPAPDRAAARFAIAMALQQVHRLADLLAPALEARQPGCTLGLEGHLDQGIDALQVTRERLDPSTPTLAWPAEQAAADHLTAGLLALLALANRWLPVEERRSLARALRQAADAWDDASPRLWFRGLDP